MLSRNVVRRCRKRTLNGIEDSSKRRTTPRLRNHFEHILFHQTSKRCRFNSLCNEKPSRMDKSVISFEHEAGNHDFGLGGTHWVPLPLATQDSTANFFNSGISGDQNYNPSQQFLPQMLDPALEDAMTKIETHPHLPFAGPSFVNRPYEHDQLASQPQSGPQPVSMHQDPNPTNDDSYTKFCGVWSLEEQSPTRNDRCTDSAYHCPRCNKGFTRRTVVKEHFPHCITMHGNPHRLRWDDHVSLRPIRKGETKDEARTHEFRKGKIRDKARTDRFRDTLKEYSGVVISSRLPPGQALVKFVSSTRASSKRPGHHLCAVCGGGTFSSAHHVKSHFINCVRKYGNPTGANWYDRLDPKHTKKLIPERPDGTTKAPPAMSV